MVKYPLYVKIGEYWLGKFRREGSQGRPSFFRGVKLGVPMVLGG